MQQDTDNQLGRPVKWDEHTEFGVLVKNVIYKNLIIRLALKIYGDDSKEFMSGEAIKCKQTDGHRFVPLFKLSLTAKIVCFERPINIGRR